ncbi:LPXTG cell wall anchor domain-containing protein [Microbacterium sp. BWT-B31]
MIGWTEITITGSLPATGGDGAAALGTLGAGAALVGAGVLLTLLRRRRAIAS